MSNQSVSVQIALKKEIRDKANEAAIRDGFDNLPAFLRYMTIRYVNGDIIPRVVPRVDVEYLTSSQEEILSKENEKFKKAEKSGKVKTAKTLKEIFDFIDQIG